MNLPDNLMLGGAMMALASVLLAVMVVSLGNREARKQAAQHPRPTDPEHTPTCPQSADADASPCPPGNPQGAGETPGTDLHLQLTLREKEIILSLRKL